VKLRTKPDRLCQAKGIPAPVLEHVFALPRKWRFDVAWLNEKIALEIEGGTFAGGRHTRGAGFRADMEKYNRAVLLGWRVVRVLPEQLVTPSTFEMLEELFGIQGPVVVDLMAQLKMAPGKAR
jgi:hypothetical protein